MHPLAPGVTRITVRWLGPWKRALRGEVPLVAAVEETIRRQARQRRDEAEA